MIRWLSTSTSSTRVFREELILLITTGNAFPVGREFQFKRETLALLKASIAQRDSEGLANILAVIWRDGVDRDYTQLLLGVFDETWHGSEEDIVSVLEQIKDPTSVEKLYEIALDVPDSDDMRALAKKCMWALSSINTPESIEKLKILQSSDDWIVSENATFQLENVVNLVENENEI